MDSLEIREMLISLGNTTPCPICKKKIPSSGIKLSAINNNFCKIEFSCQRCNESFSGYAQMIKKLPSSLENLNASSIVLTEKNTIENVSKNEVQAVKNIFKKDISLSKLFSDIK